MRDLSIKELLQRMSRLFPSDTRIIAWKYSNSAGTFLKGVKVPGLAPKETLSYRELLRRFQQTPQTRYPPRQLYFPKQSVRELSSREVISRIRKIFPDARPLLFEKYTMEDSKVTVLKGFRPSFEFGYTNFFRNYRLALAYYERTLNEKRGRNLS